MKPTIDEDRLAKITKLSAGRHEPNATKEKLQQSVVDLVERLISAEDSEKLEHAR